MTTVKCPSEVCDHSVHGICTLDVLEMDTTESDQDERCPVICNSSKIGDEE